MNEKQDIEAWKKFLLQEILPRRDQEHQNKFARLKFNPKKDQLPIHTFRIDTAKFRILLKATPKVPVYPETLEKLAHDAKLKPEDQVYKTLFEVGQRFMWSMDWPLVHDAMRERGWEKPTEDGAEKTGEKDTPTAGSAIKIDNPKKEALTEPDAETPLPRISLKMRGGAQANPLSQYILSEARKRYFPMAGSGLTEPIGEADWKKLPPAQQKIYKQHPTMSMSDLSLKLCDTALRLNYLVRSAITTNHFPGSDLQQLFRRLRFTETEEQLAQQYFQLAREEKAQQKTKEPS